MCDSPALKRGNGGFAAAHASAVGQLVNLPGCAAGHLAFEAADAAAADNDGGDRVHRRETDQNRCRLADLPATPGYRLRQQLAATLVCEVCNVMVSVEVIPARKSRNG